MKTGIRTTLVLCCTLLLLAWTGISGKRSALAAQVADPDSSLIVKNNIRKVKAYSETEVRRDLRNSFDSEDQGPPATEYHTTWTEYDRQGRVILVVDSATASDNKGLTIQTDKFVYNGNALREHQYAKTSELMEGRPTKKTIRLESTKWNRDCMLHHSEQEEAGQWNVQTDSTVYNSAGQKRITYSYNSMGDSFVEEFTYDAKARLKYRRLTMKQFWSPPWEMESSSYSYNENGGKSVVDSVWRMNPDMKAARSRAGDVRAVDYKWKVLMAAPATGSFDRLETRKESWYDSRDSLVHYQLWEQYAYMWEDYTWVYDKDSKLVLTTEYRGDRPGDHSVYGTPCTDSIWYEYKNGIVYHEKVKRFCNGSAISYDDTFQLSGVPVDPDRSVSFTYEDKNAGLVKVVSRYRHNKIVATDSYNEKGLLIRREENNFRNEPVVIKYTYFTW